jgi:hypothetical protein
MFVPLCLLGEQLLEFELLDRPVRAGKSQSLSKPFVCLGPCFLQAFFNKQRVAAKQNTRIGMVAFHRCSDEVHERSLSGSLRQIRRTDQRQPLMLICPIEERPKWLGERLPFAGLKGYRDFQIEVAMRWMLARQLVGEVFRFFLAPDSEELPGIRTWELRVDVFDKRVGFIDADKIGAITCADQRLRCERSIARRARIGVE